MASQRRDQISFTAVKGQVPFFFQCETQCGEPVSERSGGTLATYLSSEFYRTRCFFWKLAICVRSFRHWASEVCVGHWLDSKRL